MTKNGPNYKIANCALEGGLRWLNTVLWAVSGNPRDGACFKLDK